MPANTTTTRRSFVVLKCNFRISVLSMTLSFRQRRAWGLGRFPSTSSGADFSVGAADIFCSWCCAATKADEGWRRSACSVRLSAFSPSVVVAERVGKACNRTGVPLIAHSPQLL